MRRLRSVRGSRLAALFAAAVLVVGCTSPASSGTATAVATPAKTTSADAATPASGVVASSPEESTPPRGGTLRVVMAPGDAALRDPSPDVLDPQVDGSLRLSIELWRCCLVRTLVSHNGRSAGEGGARLQPDLAEGLPDVSADGLTWTFHLKPGLRYAPPLENVEITAGDFVRGFHRLLAPSIAPWNAWNFQAIEGAAEYSAGTAASITGIEAPDDRTLAFHLTEPTADFGARLASAAAGPLPPDPLHPDATTGIAAGADTGYGRFLVSSGPYMLEGSEALDFSVPAAQRTPVAGFAPGRLTFVRNPSWDPSTDDLRPAYADRIEITVADTVEAGVAALDAGTADLVVPSAGTPTDAEVASIAAFGADPSRGRAHIDPIALVRTVFINLAVPPFDDVHVRRALAWVLDREALVDLEGASIRRGPFTHVFADIYEDDLLGDYDPYATPGGHGDLEKARAEMRLSRYDTDGDGRCDASACRKARTVTREIVALGAREIALEASALGIGLDVDVLDDAAFWAVSDSPTDKVPIVFSMAFGTFSSASPLAMMFDGPQSIDVPPGTYNYTMLGAAPGQLEQWGYAVTDVPSVDARVEACLPLVGAAQFQCWASLDQYLMESVVPVLPYAVVRSVSLSSRRVVAYDFSTFTESPAFDRLAVLP